MQTEQRLENNPCSALQNEMGACRKCAQLLATKPVNPLVNDDKVESRPIVSGIRRKPVILIGQAPGLEEYKSGRPFQGRAGQDVRDLFNEAGLPRGRFDELVYSSAVVKCYPGRKLVFGKRSGKYRPQDEKPGKVMVNNCRPFLKRQLDVVDPRVVVTLGAFPLQAYLEMRGRGEAEAKLDGFVGRSEDWDGRTVVFLAHTSGLSTWPNQPANKVLIRRSKELLRKAFIENNIATL